jgi:amino acid adenylation domain-containing protein
MTESRLAAVLPLSPLQEGLLFHSIYHTDGVDVYITQTVLDLEGPLRTRDLREACRGLLCRHPNLRAGFVQLTSGRTIQAIPREFTVPWTELDLTADVAPDTALQRVLEADQRRRFDPAVPPLIRFALARLAPQRHVLVLTAHHILLDGWSMPILLRDLVHLYSSGGEPGELPPPVPYHSYLGWLEKQDRAPAAAAWRRALAGIEEPTVVAPAVDLAGPTGMPGRVSRELSTELTAALAGTARSRGLTLNTVVQGAWALLLSQLTGRHDIVFGSTVSGRPPELPGVEEIVGLLINTLPVRVRVDLAESLADLLTRVQNDQLSLMPYQYLGLADIHRLVGVNRLFDTTVVFENHPAGHQAIAGVETGLRVTARKDDAVTGIMHYPLSLTAVPGEQLALDLNYRPDAFERTVVQRLAGRLDRLLEAIASTPDRPIGRLDLLPADERDQLVTGSHACSHPVPYATLAELFEEQVARTPDATAVVCGGEKVSYRELNERAGRLAHVLHSRGAGPGRLVAVLLPRSVELLVVLYAVHKTGAAYLPVEPDTPPERVRYMLEDARPVVVVTPESYRALAAETPVSAPLPPVDPRWPAYVIYTSGSTGRPKGVSVPHQGVVNTLLWMQARFGLAPEERVLQKTATSFDVSAWELFWPLMAGATLVIAKPGGHLDPAYLASLIQRERVTTVHFVPTMLEVFLQAPEAASCTTLRRVLSIGEPLSGQLSEQCCATLDAELHNLYGPTEASIHVTAARYRREADLASVSIGRPIWNNQVYVLDAGLRPAPVGVSGELYISGVSLAQGYLNRPGLTAERFVACPFGQPGLRMYRTGDLGHRTGDGSLVFSGRVDDQVKIRGYRVELGEVESVLAGHPGLRQAAVVVRADGPVGKQLVAYVVPAPGVEAVDNRALSSYVAAHLPDYMVPAAFVELAELPMMQNGKLDRRALPAPEPAPAAGGRLPRSQQEALLCSLFADVLGVSDVGIDESFVDLGGDSIASIRLTAQARKAGFALTPRDVLTYKTVAALAANAGRPDDDRSRRIGYAGPDPAADPSETGDRQLARPAPGTGREQLDVLLALRAVGSKPPLFCVHPLLGLSWCYLGLVQHIGSDRPVYGLQARDLAEPTRRPADIAEVARDYIAEIRAVQPHGPYQVLGWSFGGLIAHEIAAQLEAYGHEVALLALMDSYPDAGGRAELPVWPDLLVALVGGVEVAAKILADFPERPSDEELAVAVRRHIPAMMDAETGTIAVLADTVLNHLRILEGHTPGRFNGEALFFRAAGGQPGEAAAVEAWKPHIAGVEVHEIECGHLEMAQPGPLAHIGRVLSGRLATGWSNGARRGQ